MGMQEGASGGGGHGGNGRRAIHHGHHRSEDGVRRAGYRVRGA